MKCIPSIAARLLAASALAFGAAQFSYAQPPQPPAGETGKDAPAFPRTASPAIDGRMAQYGAQRIGPPFLWHLQLSEEQQDRIFDILHKQAPAQRNSEKLRHKSQAALQALGNSGKYNDATAQSLARSIGQASADLALLRARTDKQILDVLTAEQRQQLSEQPMPPRAWHGEDPRSRQ